MGLRATYLALLQGVQVIDGHHGVGSPYATPLRQRHVAPVRADGQCRKAAAALRAGDEPLRALVHAIDDAHTPGGIDDVLLVHIAHIVADVCLDAKGISAAFSEAVGCGRSGEAGVAYDDEVFVKQSPCEAQFRAAGT